MIVTISSLGLNPLQAVSAWWSQSVLLALTRYRQYQHGGHNQFSWPKSVSATTRGAVTSLKLIFTLILTAQTEASRAAKLAQAQHSCMSLWVRHVRTQGHEPSPTSMHVIMDETTGREHCQDVVQVLCFVRMCQVLCIVRMCQELCIVRVYSVVHC